MKKESSIKKQLLIIISLGILIPLIVMIIISANRFKTFSINLAEKNMADESKQLANFTKHKLDETYASVNTFANIIKSNINKNKQLELSLSQIHKMQTGFLEANKQILSIYTDISGINSDSILSTTNTNNLIIADFSENYLKNNNFPFSLKTLKNNQKQENIISIPPTNKIINDKNIFIVSCGKIIKNKEQNLGIVGVDISLNWIQNYFNKNSFFNKQANICIISANNIIVASNKDKKLLGKQFTALDNITEKEKELYKTNKEHFISEKTAFKYLVPIKMLNNEWWHVRISVPKKVILKENNTQLIFRIILALIITSFIIGIASFALNRIINRILKLKEAAVKISEGNIDITFEKSGNDEITVLSEALQNMMIKIKAIIINVKKNTEELYNSSQELSNVAIKLAEGASEQASSTEEVSASMEQMTANIEQNAEKANIAKTIASKSAQGIKKSSNNVIETTKSMGEIANKTSIIGDIAFQTNILALNAAVEAARAGQHGKGFGVVAAEVGKLADNSKKAANEINELTDKSFLIAKKSGELLNQIAPEVQKTAQLVQEIAYSSMEQKEGTEQINSAMQQLNNVTQENVNSAEELASQVESLNFISEKLNKLIDFFKIQKQ